MNVAYYTNVAYYMNVAYYIGILYLSTKQGGARFEFTWQLKWPRK